MMPHTRTITITEEHFVKNNNPAFKRSEDLVIRTIEREIDPEGQIVREEVVREETWENFVVIEKEPLVPDERTYQGPG
jgi:hypothetical protein